MTVTFTYNGKKYQAEVENGEVLKVFNISYTRDAMRLSPVAKRGKIGEAAKAAAQLGG